MNQSGVAFPDRDGNLILTVVGLGGEEVIGVEGRVKQAKASFPPSNVAKRVNGRQRLNESRCVTCAPKDASSALRPHPSASQ